MNSELEPTPLSAAPPGMSVRIAEIRAAATAEWRDRVGIWIGDHLNISRLTRHGVLINTIDRPPCCYR